MGVSSPAEDRTCDLAADLEESVKMIGPLSEKDRMQKVLKYLHKKTNKSSMKKFCYKCRKQVAEKRLRIKGRFVTR
jgi:CCT motif